MNYYTDKQYLEELPKNAKKDLKILFFDNFLKKNGKILDIGCSVGRIISIAPKKIQGIDIDKKALEIAIKKGYNVEYANAEKKLPFKDNQFAGIYCSQVIEHLDSPLNLFKEIFRILEKGGKAIILTPDYTKTSNKEKGFWADYTHKRPFTKETLRRICFDASIENYKIYNYPGKGFRNLIRAGILNKNNWIKIEKYNFIWKGNDLILEIIK